MGKSSVLRRMRRVRRRSAAAGKPGRLDIQGLRALAVIVVILDHIAGWPSGGFVGVDIFFVISGFLITGLLIREWDRTSHISFSGFYARRVKRIVPAATVVLVATIAASAALYGQRQFQSISLDAVFAFFFTANWRFAAAGTDYFSDGGAVSPLQHFWSLSVEEQYYFVWPWLMLLILWLIVKVAKRSASSARLIVGLAIVTLSVASLAWAMYESTANPTVAYFSTLSRTWELGAGATLAIFVAPLSRLPALLRPVLAWVGLVGIGVSLFLINDSLPFPAPWALLPVLSTVLVLAANSGTQQQAAYLWPLTNPVSKYLGDISYSLYLWHFPIVIFAGSFFPAGSAGLLLSSFVATLLFSIASYHLIEWPAQKSPLFTAGRRSERREVWLRWAREFGPRYKYGSVALLALATSGIVAVAFAPPPPAPPAAIAPAPVPTTTDGASAQPVTAAATLASQIEQALALKAFPTFDPAIGDISTEELFATVTTSDCLNISSTQQSIDCESGPTDTGLDVVVLGDSYGIAWTPGIKAALEPLGYRIHPMTRGECPASWVSVKHTSGSAFPECDTAHEWRQERIAEIKPELTIIAQSQPTIYRMESKGSPKDHAEELADGLRRTVDGIAANTGRIIVLSSPPDGKQMRECATNFGSPADCVTKPQPDFVTTINDEENALKGTTAEYVDTRDWFCESGRCPGFVGSTPIRVDTGHLSIQYSTMLAPVIAETVMTAPTP
ncbi:MULTISPECIES: acyltransferase family protein [unclassified Rathayibacter]|uniref:acyltransferase family protein n=1 Tax=unclassified Rathayibacter TaxID=2609250 RepID=UPI00188D3611|nr:MULTISPECIES: acyltransferase family protein [unclassified Rathayibacter]MBF4462086.1 acyltransferase [Rathayibacter sp. VKM Ac-2879]MBF4503871.1 acyltransferase [Rathayibacter sp. VKM Ac-2878]